MSNQGEDGVDTDVATAVGLWILGAASLGHAAEIAGVTRWEVEAAIEDAGVAERMDAEHDGSVAAEIDAILDEGN